MKLIHRQPFVRNATPRLSTLAASAAGHSHAGLIERAVSYAETDHSKFALTVLLSALEDPIDAELDDADLDPRILAAALHVECSC